MKTKFKIDENYLTQSQEYVNTIDATLEGCYLIDGGADLRVWYRFKDGRLESKLLVPKIKE